VKISQDGAAGALINRPAQGWANREGTHPVQSSKLGADVEAMRSKTGLLSVPGALLALLAWATPGVGATDEGDPPGRAARVSDVEGSVSLQPAGVQEWTAASLNRPLTTGDRLWCDENSRAELDAGDIVMRLGAGTAFAFLSLDDTVAQMQLTSGTLIVRVRDIQPEQIYEIDTPNLAVSLQQPGEYRVQIGASGDTTVVRVSDGAALAAGGGQTVAIAAQQEVTFTGTNTLSYEVVSSGPGDDFDSWSASRDQQVEDSASGDYVASYVPGTQDLDNNGTWQQSADYGYVWIPSAVGLGWIPYRYGHWVWVNPWGWSWVEDAPWGYAPFHYGRWVQCNNSSWCWVPPPRGLRPAYAPALVAWVGAPAGAASGGFAGQVGWFPLGPREVYVPAYRASAGYVRRVNITNTTIVNTTTITNIYQNNIPPSHYVNNRSAAVTAVAQGFFLSGQKIGANALHLTPGLLTGAVVSTAAPPIVPALQSVLGGPTDRRITRPPAAVLRRSVVAHALPPPAPVPFGTLVAAVAANGGRPLARAELAKLQPAGQSQVRVIAIAGPVMAANVLTHHAGNGHPGTASALPASSAPDAPVSFAERERILEQPTRLPPPAHAAPASARANAFMPPEFPGETASAVPTYAPPGRAQPDNGENSTPTYSPARASAAAPALPVYHPPGDSADNAAPDSHPAAPVHRAPAPAAPAKPPPPSQTSKTTRDPAAHADRDSRERLVR
jgi:hypothetical protein